MLTLEEKATVWQLIDSGLTNAEVARRTGRSIGTIYNIKKGQSAKAPEPSSTLASTKILPVKDFLDQQIRNGSHNNTKLLNDARAEGYEGSYGLLKSYVSASRKLNRTYRRSQRVQTTPGEQAQVDWGSFGKIKIGERVERLYAFVYVLSYSRAIYIEFVVRQNQQTLHDCHIHAFNELGIPRNIRYDNMKTVVLSRQKLSNGQSKDYINPAFADFARYYGFKIELCPRYWPRSKGKVESAVKYVRNNFMEQQIFEKTFKTLDDINELARRWTSNVAQERTHNTTKEKPKDLWRQEKRFLQFPGLPAYNSNPLLYRHSTKDGLVQYKSNLYAVPMAFAQKKLLVRETAHHGLAHLEIYYKNRIIMRHIISLERGKWVIDGEDLSLDQDLIPKPGQSVAKRQRPKRPVIEVVPRGLSHYNNFIPE